MSKSEYDLYCKVLFCDFTCSTSKTVSFKFQYHVLPEPRNLETNKNVHLADQTESALLDLLHVGGVVTEASLTPTFQLVVKHIMLSLLKVKFAEN